MIANSPAGPLAQTDAPRHVRGNTEQIPTGIVGLGKMGAVRLETLLADPAFKVVAVCDVAVPPPDHPVHRMADRPVFVRDYAQLLAMPLESVLVCTPNAMTARIVVDALEAGKHVFCEKPPGRTLAETKLIYDAHRRHPTQVLKFGFNHRYHSAVQEAKAIVAGGRLGSLLWMRGLYGKSGGRSYLSNWRSRREMAGGGILLDQGIHMLDLFLFFGGEFDEVRSYIGRLYWDAADVEDNAFALLRNRDGLVAMLHSSATFWKHTFQLDLCCTDGYVTISGILSGTRSYGRETLIVGRRQFESDAQALGNPREEIVYFDRDLSWQQEMHEFAASIRDGQPVAHGTGEDALRLMDLVDRIYAADGTGGRTDEP